MPELPEVEFCARRLGDWLLGNQIIDAGAYDGSPLRGQSSETLCARVRGARCTAIRRLGKQLFLDFSNGNTLLCHLGMTGRWRRTVVGQEPSRWLRLWLDLEGGCRLEYVDPRRFGRLRAVRTSEASQQPEIVRLGPDALELAQSPGGFTVRLSASSRAIKVHLMDQRVMAGVGNIYAAEALLMAGVNPWKASSSLGEAQAERLAGALVECMELSIAREQDDEIRYLQDAESSNPFLVYGREGEPCPRCARPILKDLQQGRSTFWCGHCQA